MKKEKMVKKVLITKTKPEIKMGRTDYETCQAE
jgi:hypothetical protein